MVIFVIANGILGQTMKAWSYQPSVNLLVSSFVKSIFNSKHLRCHNNVTNLVWPWIFVELTQCSYLDIWIFRLMYHKHVLLNVRLLWLLFAVLYSNLVDESLCSEMFFHLNVTDSLNKCIFNTNRLINWYVASSCSSCCSVLLLLVTVFGRFLYSLSLVAVTVYKTGHSSSSMLLLLVAATGHSNFWCCWSLLVS